MIFFTVPAVWAVILVSIFMASRTTSRSSTWSFWPTWTLTRCTIPAIGLRQTFSSGNPSAGGVAMNGGGGATICLDWMVEVSSGNVAGVLISSPSSTSTSTTYFFPSMVKINCTGMTPYLVVLVVLNVCDDCIETRPIWDQELCPWSLMKRARRIRTFFPR